MKAVREDVRCTRRCGRTPGLGPQRVRAAPGSVAVLVLAALAAVLAFGAPAHAQTEHEIGEDSILKPDAVPVGGGFRLVFVSVHSLEAGTGQDALSTDIDDYNAWVQAAAAVGLDEIQPYADDFRVLGSTADVSARENTQTWPEDTQVPIYWVRNINPHTPSLPVWIADDYDSFYNGTWGVQTVPHSDGSESVLSEGNGNFVTTGSELDGSTSAHPLGGEVDGQVTTWTTEKVIVGATNTFPFVTIERPASDDHLFFGISPIFRVTAAASLKELALTDGAGDAVALDPGFSVDQTEYTASVTGAQVTVLAQLPTSTMTVEYLDADGTAIADLDGTAGGLQIGLEFGARVVQVRVTSGDGVTTRTYTVTVTRTADVLLTNLEEPADTGPSSQVKYVSAQRFTTGSNPAGYRLASVTLPVVSRNSLNVSDTLLSVWSSTDLDPDFDEPGAKIADLVTPPTLALGDQLFSAPHGRFFLDAGKSYYLVANHGLESDPERILAQVTLSGSYQSAHGWTVDGGALISVAASPPPWGGLQQFLSMRRNARSISAAARRSGRAS